jgi:hypothetical protein
MTRTSKRIVSVAVETLNELLDSDPRAEVLFAHHADGMSVLDVINSILVNAAEGASIVAARETDGTLVGFVPKRQKVAREVVDQVEGGLV